MSWRVVPHTADSGAEIEAPDLEGLFGDAARALVDLVVEEAPLEPRASFRVNLEAPDLPALLVAWLEELIYLVETRGFLAKDFEFQRLEPTGLDALVRGDTLDPARHGGGREVKAATWHGLVVEPTPGGWRARVLFDL